jgi:hypothetical protein
MGEYGQPNIDIEEGWIEIEHDLMTETMSINQIAATIVSEFPGAAAIEHTENPRVEMDDHYYSVVHTVLGRPRAHAEAALHDPDRPSVRRRRAL